MSTFYFGQRIKGDCINEDVAIVTQAIRQKRGNSTMDMLYLITNVPGRNYVIDVKIVTAGEVLTLEEALVFDDESFRYQVLGGRLGSELTFKSESDTVFAYKTDEKNGSWSGDAGTSSSSSSSMPKGWTTKKWNPNWRQVEKALAREKKGEGTRFWDRFKGVKKAFRRD